MDHGTPKICNSTFTWKNLPESIVDSWLLVTIFKRSWKKKLGKTEQKKHESIVDIVESWLFLTLLEKKQLGKTEQKINMKEKTDGLYSMIFLGFIYVQVPENPSIFKQRSRYCRPFSLTSTIGLRFPVCFPYRGMENRLNSRRFSQ